jgi:Yip1 domain
MSEYPNVGPTYGMPQGSTPTEGSYSASPQDPSADEPPVRPLPLGEAIRQLPTQYIRVLTNPGAAVFAQEQGKAAWNITWVQIVLYAAIAALVGVVGLNTTLTGSLTSIQALDQIIQHFGDFSFIVALRAIIIPIFFFVGVFFCHLLAKAFGGRGRFLPYFYCSILYRLPISIIGGAISIMVVEANLPSQISSLVAVALGIYSIMMQVFVTMVVHRLSGGKATWSVLLVPIVLVGLLLVVAFLAGILALFWVR